SRYQLPATRNISGRCLARGRGWESPHRREGSALALRSCPESELLSQRVRRPLCPLNARDELLVPQGCCDPEPILAERPHLHVAPRCLYREERRDCATLPGSGLSDLA